ncbi:prolyl oligopeptidase family serine peptidase [bacterium]|nr:prolyl oligopeptidase family serine peptidase [bacterium]
MKKYNSKKNLALLLGAVLCCASTNAMTVSFQEQRSSVFEGSRDELIIVVELSEATEKSINIPFQVFGSASSRDYRLNSRNRIRVRRGETRAELELRPRDDRYAEGTENLIIQLLPDEGFEVGENSQHEVEILDDEGSPAVLEFQSSALEVSEEKKEVEILIKLDRPASENVRFELSVEGSATDRDDYRIKDDTLQVRRGESSVVAIVDIEDDELYEPAESVVLHLVDVDGAVLGAKSEFVLTIAENDKDVVWKQDCFDSTVEELSYSYCITKTPDSRSKDVLYYFHGAFGGDKDWTEGSNAEMRRKLRLYWSEKGYDAPAVVGISLDTLWMLRAHESADGDLANLVQIADGAIPAIEAEHFGGEIMGRRLLMGVSMGGFNALTIMMQRPGLWDKAAIIAPMIPLCNPWLPDDYIYMCVASDEHKNNVLLAKVAHDLVKQEFPTQFHWEQSNPLNVAKSKLNPDSVPFLLTTGTVDDFAFYTNSEKFAATAEQLGAPIKWAPTDYAHGVFDPELLGEFLLSK